MFIYQSIYSELYLLQKQDRHLIKKYIRVHDTWVTKEVNSEIFEKERRGYKLFETDQSFPSVQLKQCKSISRVQINTKTHFDISKYFNISPVRFFAPVQAGNPSTFFLNICRVGAPPCSDEPGLKGGSLANVKDRTCILG